MLCLDCFGDTTFDANQILDNLKAIITKVKETQQPQQVTKQPLQHIDESHVV